MYTCQVLGLFFQVFVSPKYNFFGLFFLGLTRTQEGVWPYRHSYNVHLATLIPNIYEFVGITIGSKYFKSNIFGIFTLTHKKEEVWPDGTHPMIFAESSCVYIPIFRPIASFCFMVKVPFLWIYFFIQKGEWPYRHT